jgi:RimJ/RimL family protein N-acetyltransferase
MNKLKVDPIESSKARFRLIQESDLSMTMGWRNKPRVAHWFKSAALITPEQHRQWFEEYLQRDNDYLFIIEDKNMTDAPVGQVGIYNIDFSAGTAEVGRFLIGEERALGRNMLVDVHRNWLLFWREQHGITEVRTEVRRDNYLALRVNKGCGYVEVGSSGDMVQLVYGGFELGAPVESLL